MTYYINCIKNNQNISRDIKELIPSMNTRRRMSNILKYSVTTALDCIADFEKFHNIDAIITSSWLGCIADSEKFLANLIIDKEQLLNPTPFIQSTFNTVGAQIALIKNLKCYNNTFTNANSSFDSALLDSILQLNANNAKAVLLGHFDEITPSVKCILNRLNYKNIPYQGAIFCVVTKEQLPCSIAKISNLNVDNFNKQNKQNLAETIYNYCNSENNNCNTIQSNAISLNIECL